MAMIYATLITKGVKQFKDVPRILKDKVRQILIDLDLAELAVEDAAIATDSNAKKEDE